MNNEYFEKHWKEYSRAKLELAKHEITIKYINELLDRYEDHENIKGLINAIRETIVIGLH